MSRTETIKETATRLNEALDVLEAALDPLFTSTFVDQIGRLTEPIDQCKLEVSMAYAINTVFWIYFKTHGLSPKEHQVFTELERVKKYFGKIKTAEGFVEKRNLLLNKPAAGRILKHALAGNKDPKDVEDGDDEATRFLDNAFKGQSTRSDDIDRSNAGKRRGHEEDSVLSPKPPPSRDNKKRKTDQLSKSSKKK